MFKLNPDFERRMIRIATLPEYGVLRAAGSNLRRAALCFVLAAASMPLAAQADELDELVTAAARQDASGVVA